MNKKFQNLLASAVCLCYGLGAVRDAACAKPESAVSVTQADYAQALKHYVRSVYVELE